MRKVMLKGSSLRTQTSSEKSRKSTPYFLAVLFAFAVVLGSCSKDNATDPAATDQNADNETFNSEVAHDMSFDIGSAFIEKDASETLAIYTDTDGSWLCAPPSGNCILLDPVIILGVQDKVNALHDLALSDDTEATQTFISENKDVLEGVFNVDLLDAVLDGSATLEARQHSDAPHYRFFNFKSVEGDDELAVEVHLVEESNE